jgi:dTDP-glucose 4,6-dehydratase
LVEEKRVSFERIDITDEAAINSLFERERYDLVFHLAAESHVDRSIMSAREFVSTNVMGTQVLIDAAYKHGVSKFVHISTDEVYGSLAPTAPAFTETHPHEPNSPYSASKAASDHLVRAWFHTYGFPVVTTNCSNNYGPYQFPEKLIPLVIHNAINGKSLPIYGDGQQVRDWLYVGDHCSAIRTVLAKGSLGDTYNIGGWNEKTNLEVVNAICKILDELRPRADGQSYAQQITFVKDRPGHDRRYAIDARKIERELGWRPAETFDTGIRKPVRWYLDNPQWVEGVVNGTYRDWLQKQYS